MISSADIDAIGRAEVLDRDGRSIGPVGRVYVSDDGAQPLFVTVRTGPTGARESFVPLQGAGYSNGDLHVVYDRATIEDAPEVVGDGVLSDDEQGTIFDYYDGRAGGSASGTDDAPAGLTGADTGGIGGADLPSTGVSPVGGVVDGGAPLPADGAPTR